MLVNHCKKCKKAVSQRDIRIARDGKSIICPECYEAKHGIKPARPYSQLDALQIEPVETREEKTAVRHGRDEYVVYQCTKCGYKFSRKKSFVFKKCPYCGEPTVGTFEDRLTASKLLNE